MHDFKNRLARFFYGRYGTDSLYYALTVLWCVLIIIGGLTQSAICSLLSWACLIYLIYRTMSKNIARRRAENEAFLRLWNPVKSFCKLQILRVKERKTHVYRRCPQCHAALRLPRRRGEHTVSCPRCAQRLDVRIR